MYVDSSLRTFVYLLEYNLLYLLDISVFGGENTKCRINVDWKLELPITINSESPYQESPSFDPKRYMSEIVCIVILLRLSNQLSQHKNSHPA